MSVLAGSSEAAVPAAWEKFPTRTNASVWRVFDYTDGLSYLPEWDSSVAGGEYIWLRHNGEEPLEFSADSSVAGGAFVGDYTAANVGAISCEIFIEALNDFSKVDCSVFTTGTDGVVRWYYSRPYLKEDFTDNGWWSIRFGMDEPWAYFNGTRYVSVIPDATFLRSIKEVSVTVFPKAGITANRIAAIDNFILEPVVIAPPLTTSTTPGAFRITCKPAPGLTPGIQRLTTVPPFVWSDVDDGAFIADPSVHSFTTAMDVPVKIFRVVVSPAYHPVVTPP